MASGWSIQILGDYIEQFIVDTRVNVDVDRKFVITSVGRHPEAIAGLRHIKKLAKDRLFSDGVLRPRSAAALEKQYGFVVLTIFPLGTQQDYYGIHTPMGIIIID